MNGGFRFSFHHPYSPGGQDVLEDAANPVNAGTTFSQAELSAAAVTDAYFIDLTGDGVIADADTDDTESYLGFSGDRVNIGATSYDIMEIDRDGDAVSHITYDGVQMGAAQGVVFEVMYLSDGSHFVTFTDGSIATMAAQSGGVGAALFSSVVCFAGGKLIRVPGGEVPVEALTPGDIVMTMDHGPQPLHWVGHQHVSAAAARINPKLLPVCIPAGVLGPGVPSRDLHLSRQHRVLIDTGPTAPSPRALVAAVRLLPLPGVHLRRGPCTVDCHHLLFERHQIVFANGAPCERLLTGDQALSVLDESSMPMIAQTDPPAAWIPSNAEQKRLINSRLQAEANAPCDGWRPAHPKSEFTPAV